MSDAKSTSTELGQGCGPLLPVGTVGTRPLRHQVFDRIRAAGSAPRVDVARSLEVSAGSVTTLTAELIDAGLLVESQTKERDTGRGRPPVALAVNAKAGYVAGIKLSDQEHTAVILDFAGNRIAHATLGSDEGYSGMDNLVNAAETVLTRALEKSNLKLEMLDSVGLGLPGMVDNETGMVPWSPLVSEADFPMKTAFQDRIGCAVSIDNDANLVTLAELWFGIGRARSDFAVVTIEHGVGMGLVLNHQLFRGSMGLGLELGHTKVQLDGALCRCGQRGCLEAYVADYALVREASTALNWNKRSSTAPQIMLESLYDHAKAGNLSAQAIFHRAGRFLALGLANVVNIFDPSLILLSGERLKFDFLYEEEVLAEMSNLTVTRGRKAPQVKIQAWGDLVWAQGAAALALENATTEKINTVFVS